ncbi:cupin domain-containing protein [Natronosalvus vescus]|uniref:cupin domain-containing protein n=1 Tax=Natronosalvus vescus TaxID=2953881 RepID=UPI0020906ADB|nr:cupin domain-containing protein [Natronosalvus vescus]
MTGDPIVVRETAAETDGAFVEFELTLYPRASATGDEYTLPHERWLIDFPIEHVHPRQAEHWQVLSGELGVSHGEVEDVLKDGDTVRLPAGVPHRIWNPSDEPSRVTLAFHPALEAQSLTETLYVLAQLERMDERGRLNPLQFAVTQAAHPDHLYLTSVPVSVQKALVRILAPIGQYAGYQPRYSLDELDGGH